MNFPRRAEKPLPALDKGLYEIRDANDNSACWVRGKKKAATVVSANELAKCLRELVYCLGRVRLSEDSLDPGSLKKAVENSVDLLRKIGPFNQNIDQDVSHHDDL